MTPFFANQSLSSICLRCALCPISYLHTYAYESWCLSRRIFHKSLIAQSTNATLELVSCRRIASVHVAIRPRKPAHAMHVTALSCTRERPTPHPAEPHSKRPAPIATAARAFALSPRLLIARGGAKHWRAGIEEP